jgi:alpha-beta hydrolase superfamily lysophospholipase
MKKNAKGARAVSRFALLAALFIAAGCVRVASAQAADKEVTVFGQKIHYVEAGSGPVVVLLHGLGGNTTNWAFNVPALAQKYRVIVPDQIGFGRSDKPLINYRVGTYADFLDKFLDELKVEKASLVGNSMGGWMATLVGNALRPQPLDARRDEESRREGLLQPASQERRGD